MRGILFSLAIILILLSAAGAWRSDPSGADAGDQEAAGALSNTRPAVPQPLGPADLAQILELRRQFGRPLSDLEPAALEGDGPTFEGELRRVGRLDAHPAETPVQSAPAPPISPSH